MCGTGSVLHLYYQRFPFGGLYVCVLVSLLMASDWLNYTSKLYNTSKHLLPDSFLQEIKDGALRVSNLFHEL